MPVTSTDVRLAIRRIFDHTAHSLGAKDFATKEADAWVCDFAGGVRRAFPPGGFFNKEIVVSRKRDELVDGWVWDGNLNI